MKEWPGHANQWATGKGLKAPPVMQASHSPRQTHLRHSSFQPRHTNSLGDITGSSCHSQPASCPALLILPAQCQLVPPPFWAPSRVQDHILPHLTLLFTFSTLDHPAGLILKHHCDVTLLLKAITHPHRQAADSKFVLLIRLPCWLRR